MRLLVTIQKKDSIMGKRECSTASVGVKIKLSDVVSQINETNFALIHTMLCDGWIEDENDYFNEVYSSIVWVDDMPQDHKEAKEYLTHAFTHQGTYHKSRSSAAIPTLDYGCLLDQYLLVPFHTVLSCERWGHDRYGTNSTSRPIDFDLIHSNPYKDIEHITVVFMLRLHSG
jgi:hypothetical protein